MAMSESGVGRTTQRRSSTLRQYLTVRAGRPRRAAILGWCVVVLHMLGCEPKVVIGAWSCPPKSKSNLVGTAGAAGAAGSVAADDSFPFPWSTGFENGFDCDYAEPDGACYAQGTAKYNLVTDPVHSGSYAASFTVDSFVDNKSTHTRCLRQGTFPTEAYYSAWYFIPTIPNKVQLWNLFHFSGGAAIGEKNADRLWDVSLVKKDNGDLRLEFYNFGKSDQPLPDQSNAPSIPIGAWFRIEMYVKRAADATGEFTLYQDGTSILRMTGLLTDDTKVGTWFVGNLAENLDPVESTVYVDDVMLSATP
jgi:hypothetical protein